MFEALSPRKIEGAEVSRATVTECTVLRLGTLLSLLQGTVVVPGESSGAEAHSRAQGEPGGHTATVPECSTQHGPAQVC